MPGSHSDSSGSPPPSAMPSGDHPASPSIDGVSGRPLAWRANAWLFVATVVSVFATFYISARSAVPTPAALGRAGQFTSALLSILLAHEFGHFIAARIHGVDASLPYFIPFPILSPFGTMGAVIRMRSKIATRRALLDIGAAGPLAGLALCIPLYAWGVAHSQIVAPAADQGALGESLLVRWLGRCFAPSIPDGMDLQLSPVGEAAWVGMFVTMINLLPVGQLDGGHVAFALFGPRQNRIGRWVHRSMLVFFFVSVASFMARDLRAGLGPWRLGHHVGNSIFWFAWFEALAILGTVTSRESHPPEADRLTLPTRAFATVGLLGVAWVLYERSSIILWMAWLAALALLIVMERMWGVLRDDSVVLDHPPTSATPLKAGRVAIAVVTLTFFFLLFMPTPFTL